MEVVEPVALAEALDPEPVEEAPLLLVDEALADDEDEDPVLDFSQPRLKSGVVVSLLLTMPKLGFGVSGAASWRV